ncbi:MAG TPA: pyridoxal phosphate-dependent aminotransferase [Fimbriimonadaceae bacterium]|nr:pyridoxal phosphate-dependent aminotransferase [Fimbriimonadaceae bacterium]
MPKASHRAGEMPSSPIRRLVPLAVAAEKRGVHVHYLNIGQPDVRTPDAFWDGIRDGMLPTLAYSPSPGVPKLRETAIADYQRRGFPVESADMVISTGGSEACLWAFMVLCDPGDEVIVVEPYYANYSAMAIEAGVNLVALTTTIESGFALPSADEIAKRITPRTRAILVCNPSNPTGTSFSPAELAALAALAKRHNLFLIGDEVYRDFNYTDTPLVSVLNLPGMEDHAVMLDSVSKRFSACGARIGFFVSKNKGVMEGVNKLAQARLCSPTLEQVGVERALRETPLEYFTGVRSEYMRRRDVLLRELRAIPGVLAPNVNGAFYAIARLPVPDAEEFCKFLLNDFNLEGETVMMAPASGFYLTPGLGMDEVRIAYVLEEEKLISAMRCLRAGLEAYPATKKVPAAVK